MNTRAIGADKETTACDYLIQNGIKIKERNFRCRQGEIDIIGYDGQYLVFFEIKYRKTTSKGSAAESVNNKKQHKICRVSDYYRMIHHCPDNTPIRFDVVAIDDNEIMWYKDAFYYC